MRRLALPLCLAALALSACQNQRVAEIAPVRQAAPQMPRGPEGRWSSVGGPIAYTAMFQNGRFSSAETSTNGLLAEGSYVPLAQGQIRINYRSVKRGTQLAANCNYAGGQMTCTSADGSSFSLARA